MPLRSLATLPRWMALPAFIAGIALGVALGVVPAAAAASIGAWAAVETARAFARWLHSPAAKAIQGSRDEGDRIVDVTSEERPTPKGIRRR